MKNEPEKAKECETMKAIENELKPTMEPRFVPDLDAFAPFDESLPIWREKIRKWGEARGENKSKQK